MDDKVVRIAYATDMGLVGPTALSLGSAIRVTPSLRHVDILACSLDSDAVDLFRRVASEGNVSLTLHPMGDEMFETARHKGRHVPKTALARMFLPGIVDGRVLYIDGDTLIRRDLAPLFASELDGKLIGGVRDYGVLAGLHRISRGKDWAYRTQTEAVISPYPTDDYINSGVLIMDCAEIRREKLDEAMVQFERATGYRTVDQDFLNELFKGRVKYLNPAWNASWGRASWQRGQISRHGHGGTEIRQEKTGIYHFHGPAKPWHSLSMDMWRRDPICIATYKIALYKFRKRYPDVTFG